MAHEIEAVVGPDGWITWEALTSRVDRKTVASWVGGGRLGRIQPGVYALPLAADEWRIRLEAAVRVGGCVVSHRTALALWDLLPPASRGPVHLTVALSRSGRGTDGLVLHRTRDLVDAVRRVEGLPVTTVERARSWTRGDVRKGCPGRSCAPPRSTPSGEGCALHGTCSGRSIGAPACPVVPPSSTSSGCWPRGAGANWRSGAACTCSAGRACRCSRCSGGSRWPGSGSSSTPRATRCCSPWRWMAPASLAPASSGSGTSAGTLLASAGWQTLRFGFRRMTSSPDACRRDIRSAYQARRRLLRLDDVR